MWVELVSPEASLHGVQAAASPCVLMRRPSGSSVSSAPLLMRTQVVSGGDTP